jgi:hypothetical protein
MTEKRTKKLLSVSGNTELTNGARRQRKIDKSFLLLFCKKEVLSFVRRPDAA